MTSAQVAFTAPFASAEPGNRQRLRHDGFLHDAFQSMPWLAWTVVGLLLVLVLLSSVGKLVGNLPRHAVVGTPRPCWHPGLRLVHKPTQYHARRPPA